MRWSRRSVIKAGTALAAGMANHAAAQDDPLSFWQFYAPGGALKPQVDWFTSTVNDWNDTQDQKIELEYVPASEYVNGTKLVTAFASGRGPDIFLISPGDFLRYYNGGVLADLTPYLSDEAVADYPESVLATRSVEGRVFGIPMEVEPMAFLYSVKAFEDAGLNENDVPETWDELLELGKRLTNASRYGLLFDTTPGYYQNFTWYPFMWQGGGEIQGPDGKSAFNSTATVQALKLWQDAIQSGAAPRQVLGRSGGDTIANLGSGYCAMQNVGIWSVKEMATNAPDVPYGIFRLPIPDGGRYVTVGGGWAFVANSRGRNPEAAARFIAWSIASMSADSIQRMLTWNTVADSDMPPRNSVLAAGGASFQTGNVGVFSREIHPGTRAEPRMPPQVYKIISDAIQAVQLAGKDPEATAASASRQLDAYLLHYRGASII